MTVFFVLLAILSGLIAYLYLAIRRRFSYWQSRGIICEEPHFIFGSLQGVTRTRSFKDIWESYYNRFKDSGRPFAGFYWFFKPAVFVLEPELIKNILIKDFSKFTDRGLYNNKKDDPLTGQIFLLDGMQWKNMRQKLTPTFTVGKLKAMFPIVIKVGDELVEVLGKEIKGDSGVVDVKDFVARFTTDVIGTCAFGIECSSLNDSSSVFCIMGRRAVTEMRHNSFVIAFMASFIELARKLRMKQTPEEIEKFFLGLVKTTVAYREQHKVRRNDFMDMLIDLMNKKLMKSVHGDELTNLTLEEIGAQAFIFFAAGLDTSATTMAFALYELAQNPQLQERGRQEVVEILAKHDQAFTSECLKEMTYVEQILAETLRLYSVAPVLNRVAVEDYTVPGSPGFVIKKGMPVLIPIAAIHRDERYYPNPTVFNPDNFSAAKVAARDSVLYLPFGEGPRNCIGLRFAKMQTTIGLALLLKNFHFSICSETEVPPKLNKEHFLINTERGIYLKVTKV